MRAHIIDRASELKVLEREWSSKGFRLIIIYGRRRIGKTFLLKYFVSSRNHIYFTAIEASKDILYNELSKLVSEKFNVRVLFNNIDDILDFIVKNSRDRIVFVIDEFQYLVHSDPEAPSRIQRFIDENPNANIVLVLCGSAVSFFERELLGYRAPLFGRRTATLRLKPMKFLDTWMFYPSYNAIDAIRAYSVFGPTPAYAKFVDDSKTLIENIVDNILRKGSYLYSEAIDVLRQEVRETSTYSSILNAIALGYTKVSEIASLAGVSSKTISKYLQLLEQLDIIERTRSLGRRGGEVRVEIIDPYFLFWYKYVKPNLSYLELEIVDPVKERIEKELDLHVARVLETLVRRELVFDILIPRIIKLDIVEVGKWWYKDKEIDVVVRGTGKTVFIEVKWSNVNLGEAEKILDKLEDKALSSKLLKPENYYVLVARSIDGIEKPIEVQEHRILVDLAKTLDNIHKTRINKNTTSQP